MKPKFVVLYSMETGLIQCIGVYEDGKAAWGNAVLWLQDRIDDEKQNDEYEGKKHEYTLSNLWRTEGETGFGMEILKDGKPIGDNVMVLDVENDESEVTE